MVGIVDPPPPPEDVAIRRQQVHAFITNQLELPVRSTQTWFQGVGLYEMQDPVICAALISHTPWPLGLDQHGNELFLRFIRHDHGEGFRALQGHRTGWLMFIGVPLDYRNTQCLAEVVGTFG